MITISKKTEYSLLLLDFLKKESNDWVSLTTAARHTGMPYRFLAQLAAGLAANGLLESKEGKAGGYRLAKGWQKVSMYELMMWLGEDKHMVACLGDTKCTRADGCSARKIWGLLEMKLTKELKEIKLKDL